MWRWKVEDSDLLFERQEGRGSVVICNHTSMAELLAVETALFFGGRAFAPSLNPSSPRARLCAGPLAASAASPWSVYCRYEVLARRPACAAARRGRSDLPRGTRIRSREIKPEVHGGFALIAQMGKAPVNPLAICGWSDITPAGKKIMRPKKCWIRAGKAVSLSDAPAGLKRTERLGMV